MFDGTRVIAFIIAFLFMFIPIFSLTYGLLAIMYRDLLAYNVYKVPAYGALNIKAGGMTIPYFVFSIFFYGALTILIDKGFFKRKPKNT